jgi:L-arabinokinase
MPKIRYYISGHGLGHASRGCQIINILRRLYPEVRVEVVSNAHAWFFEEVLSRGVPVAHRQLDVGVIQRDSLVMDEVETLRAARRLQRESRRLIEEETRSLRESGIDLAVSDIASKVFPAARGAEIMSVGIANFTWEWIYQDFVARHPDYADVVSALHGEYRQASKYLLLPFHGDFPAEVPQQELPLVARRACRSRDEVRKALGLPANRQVALVSFGGFGVEGLDLKALGRLEGWTFLVESRMGSGAENVQVIAPRALPYPDLVAAADVVVTKPGYGIVSEAIANDTAVLYVSRGAFREQALLVQALSRFARACEIDKKALLRGDWGPFLERALTQARPSESLQIDDGTVAARQLAELVGVERGRRA